MLHSLIILMNHNTWNRSNLDYGSKNRQKEINILQGLKIRFDLNKTICSYLFISITTSLPNKHYPFKSLLSARNINYP